MIWTRKTTGSNRSLIKVQMSNPVNLPYYKNIFPWRKSKALCHGKRLKFCHRQLVHSLSWNTATNHEMLKNLFEIKSINGPVKNVNAKIGLLSSS